MMLDWRLLPPGPEKYQAYLASSEWGALKTAVEYRSKLRCERCRARRGTSVHHMTYARIYRELPEDLIHLCQWCHAEIHGRPTPQIRNSFLFRLRRYHIWLRAAARSVAPTMYPHRRNNYQERHR
jgi:hypothetical protein